MSLSFREMGQSGAAHFEAGRLNLFFWLHPRVWSVGAHWRSCCTLNMMLGPFEFMIRPGVELAEEVGSEG